MKHVDAPPLWLLLSLASAWAVSVLDPWDLGFGGGGWEQLLAGLGIGGGLLLIVVAVAQLRRHKTEVLPHREARVLLTTGVFRRSRNPIYLGMALILLGWCLRLDSAPALALVPLFLSVIERRFVRPEEAMLRRRFGAAFAAYEVATRRWL